MEWETIVPSSALQPQRTPALDCWQLAHDALCLRSGEPHEALERCSFPHREGHGKRGRRCHPDSIVCKGPLPDPWKPACRAAQGLEKVSARRKDTIFHPLNKIVTVCFIIFFEISSEKLRHIIHVQVQVSFGNKCW